MIILEEFYGPEKLHNCKMVSKAAFIVPKFGPLNYFFKRRAAYHFKA